MLLLKQLLCLLEPKGGTNTTYPDTISLGLWYLQYSKYWNIWGITYAIPSLCHELIEENEFKYSSSKCSNEIKQKNACYFIHALWYKETFIQTYLCLQPLCRSTNRNWIWWGITTPQGSTNMSFWTSLMIYI